MTSLGGNPLKPPEKKREAEFRKFEALTKKLLSVPKKEVDEKEAQRPKRERKPKDA